MIGSRTKSAKGLIIAFAKIRFQLDMSQIRQMYDLY